MLTNFLCLKSPWLKNPHSFHSHHHHLRLTSLVSHSWGWMWYELAPLLPILCHIFCDVQLPHVFFHYLTPGLHGLPTGLLPFTSSFIALLSMLFSSLSFTWPSHLNLIFLHLCSRFSIPNLFLTSSLVILTCHLTLGMYLNILWSQLASSPSSLSISAHNLGFPQHTAMLVSQIQSKPSLFPLVNSSYTCSLQYVSQTLLHVSRKLMTK